MGDASWLGSTANPQGRVYQGGYGKEIYGEGIKKKKKEKKQIPSAP